MIGATSGVAKVRNCRKGRKNMLFRSVHVWTGGALGCICHPDLPAGTARGHKDVFTL